MTPIFFEGLVTALSPISHSAGSNGIHTQFRRQSYVQLDGTVEECPVVHGLRGALRDVGMLAFLQRLGYGEPDETGKPRGLSVAAFDMLFSGGSLGGASSKGIDIDFARQQRKLIPLLSVFGAASGNQMLDGRCKIGFLKPICQETAHLIHPTWVYRAYVGVPNAADKLWGETEEDAFCQYWSALVDKPWPGVQPADLSSVSRRERWAWYEAIRGALPSMYDLTDQFMATRMDDKKRSRFELMMNSDTHKLLDDERRAKQDRKAEKGQSDVGRNQQMRYFTEVLSAGTCFHWYIELDSNITALEYEAFWSALGAWAQSPYVGGKLGTGLGQVAVHFGQWRSVDVQVQATEGAVAAPLGAAYHRHIEEHGREIREVLDAIS